MSIERKRSRTDWFRFYTLLAIAVVMATLGLYRNSAAVVIAAMLIAPLMSPILDVASALVMGWMFKMLRLLLGVLIASVGTIALAFVIPFVVDAPRGMVIPEQVMARTDPGLEELVVALVAGIAGAYVQMRKEEAGMLPGVAIGVSLVPPLAAAGLLLYFGEWNLAGEAVLLYITNLAAIVLCACGVFFALGLRPEMYEKGYAARVGAGAAATLIVIVIISLDLGRQTIQRFQEARDEELVLVAIKEWAGSNDIKIDRVNVSEEVEVSLIFDVPFRFTDQRIAPGEMISAQLDHLVLVERIREILGRKAKVVFRGRIRFADVVDS